MVRNRVFIDVLQTIQYLSVHSSVSGLQRVVLSVIEEFNSNNRNRISPVCYRYTTGDFVELDYDDVRLLFELLKSSANTRNINDLADEILSDLKDSPAVGFEPQDVLLILESVWITDNYFANVFRYRLNGLLVITMLHDLIPTLDPTFMDEVGPKFHRYLHGASMVSDRVVTNSQSTRNDYSAYCAAHSLLEAPGCVTQLPGGFDDIYKSPQHGLEVKNFQIWPRPYILMVGTIEVRKNHLVALRAWKDLIKIRGSQNVPDLVCVGKIGWNIGEFLSELASSDAIVKDRIHLLTENVGDDHLKSLYENCMFTIYPSSYEGWGLPVSESLDFGKAVITTNVSSMPEAGMEFAKYVPASDSNALVAAISEWLDYPEIPQALGIHAIKNRERIDWSTVVNRLIDEVDNLRESKNL
jgi:glycosyltransferase involved in cell wall biosynthesis